MEDSAGREIESFGSENLRQTWIAHLTDKVHISYFQLGAQGLVGYHQATTPQLFLVIQGEGWVRGEADERTEIKAGQAVYWEAGEWHESGTDTGMQAIVIEIETDDFDPAEYLKECVG